MKIFEKIIQWRIIRKSKRILRKAYHPSVDVDALIKDTKKRIYKDKNER